MSSRRHHSFRNVQLHFRIVCIGGKSVVTASYPGDSPYAPSSHKTSMILSRILDHILYGFPHQPQPWGKGYTSRLDSDTYGVLSYSYANLPAGCLSNDATSPSCTLTSTGNYVVTVQLPTDAGQSVNATVSIAVGLQRVLGLSQAMRVVVIFRAIIRFAR